MVFLLHGWIVIGDIDRHEEITEKLILYYKKIKELKANRYFGHFAGQDMSPWGGRTEIFEFENYAALELLQKVQQKRASRKSLERSHGPHDHTTVRFSLMSERNRELWLEL